MRLTDIAVKNARPSQNSQPKFPFAFAFPLNLFYLSQSEPV